MHPMSITRSFLKAIYAVNQTDGNEETKAYTNWYWSGTHTNGDYGFSCPTRRVGGCARTSVTLQACGISNTYSWLDVYHFIFFVIFLLHSLTHIHSLGSVPLVVHLTHTTTQAARSFNKHSSQPVYMYYFQHAPKCPPFEWAGVPGEPWTAGASHASEIEFFWQAKGPICFPATSSYVVVN